MNFDISSRIKQLRKHFDISANKLSKEIDIAQPTLSKIETNKSLPSWQLLEKICNYFDLTFSEFFNISYLPETNILSNSKKDLSSNIEMESIGYKIRFLRESKNISRSEFESMLDISQSHMSRIENNKNIPHFESLENICNIFNISISEFFSLNINNPHINLDEHRNKVSLEHTFIEKYNIDLDEIKTILKIRKFSDVEKQLLNTLLNQYDDNISEDSSLESDDLYAQRHA